jgi:hypothetical protein
LFNKQQDLTGDVAIMPQSVVNVATTFQLPWSGKTTAVRMSNNKLAKKLHKSHRCEKIALEWQMNGDNTEQ